MGSGNPRDCLICKSDEYRVVFSYDKPDQYEKSLRVREDSYHRKWVQCRQCGFYYSIYSREKNVIERIYTYEYRYKNSPWRKESPEELFKRITALPEEESETKFRVNWLKKNIYDIWKNGLLKKPTHPYNMLDIGGGIGVFAYEFQDAEWAAHVIDPHYDSSFIKARLHIPFIQDYYKPNCFNCKFDLISLIYILEHHSDPVSLLGNLHNDMNKNSFLYIEVPDSICFQHKPAEDDIFNSCHLWMFSPNILTLFLDNCGFEVFSVHRMKTIRGHYALMVLAARKPDR